jgi:hypothetical protein
MNPIPFLVFALSILASGSFAQAADYTCHSKFQTGFSIVASPAALGGTLTRVSRLDTQEFGKIVSDQTYHPGDSGFRYSVEKIWRGTIGVPDTLWPKITSVRELTVNSYANLVMAYIGEVQVGGAFLTPHSKMKCLPDSVVTFEDPISVKVIPENPVVVMTDGAIGERKLRAPWFTATYELTNNSDQPFTVDREDYDVWNSTSSFALAIRKLDPAIILNPGETKSITVYLSSLKWDYGSGYFVNVTFLGPVGIFGFKPQIAKASYSAK